MTETAEDIWADDTLGRKADADFLISFLSGRLEQRAHQKLPRSYVLNIDAGWGGGKTFFMTRLAKELRLRGNGVALIDAWEDDHADDPMLSLMSGIEATINPLVRAHPVLDSTYKMVRKAGLNIAATATKGALKQLGRKLLGEGADIIVEQVGELAESITQKGKDDLAASIDKTIDKSAEKLLQGFEEGKKSIREFREQLGKLTDQVREKKSDWTLFVLVDELDRCRPTHAIALLERVKHLFNVGNVVFIVATDSRQLSESVKAVYGGGFNGSRYLTRFFDRTYSFPPPELERFVRAEIETLSIDKKRLSLPPDFTLDQLVLGSIQAFGATPRDVKRALELLSDLVAAWRHKIQIEAVILVPMVIGHQSGKIDINRREIFGDLANSMDDQRYGVSKFRNSSEYHGDPELTTIGELINWFSLFMNELEEIYRREDARYSVRWVQRRLSEEFQIIHNSSYDVGESTRSVIATYPSLIMTAGHLRSGDSS